MRHDSKGIMDHAFLWCLLLPLFSILWPVAGNGITYAPQSPSYNQSRGGKNCFLTAKCDNCSQSEINCYDDAELQPLYDNQFHDYFCGPHRVVLVNAEVGEQQRLSPLKCRDGKCPDGSVCLKNPVDDIFYCCATESDVPTASRCMTLEMLQTSEYPVRQKVVDENGDPVNITRITIILKNTDVQCIQGWTYYFKGDTVYLSNGCRVQFQICYESQTPILPVLTDISCGHVALRCKQKQHVARYVLDENQRKVRVISMEVTKQLSPTLCVKKKNFYFEGSKVIVKHGCQGKFKICYSTVPSPTPLHEHANRILSSPTPLYQNPVDIVPSSTPLLDESEETVASYTPFSETPGDTASSPAPLSEKPGEFVPSPTPLPQKPGIIVSSPAPLSDKPGEFVPSPTPLPEKPGTIVSSPTSLSDKPGEFALSPTPLPEKPGTIVSSPAPLSVKSDQNCQTVEFASTDERADEKTFRDNQGKPVNVISVELLERFSSARCEKGNTFNVSGPTVRVSGGCRGIFKVCIEVYDTSTSTTSATSTRRPDQNCQTVEFASTSERADEKTFRDNQGKPTNVISVELLEWLSALLCEKGKTFNVSGPTVRVSDGCRGIFKVCIEVYDTSTFPTSATSTRRPAAPICFRVTLQGLDKKTATASVQGSSNTPVQVIRMELIRQFSSVQCRKWYNYFFEAHLIAAKDGCHAQFEVCYIKQVTPTPPAFRETPDNGVACRIITLLSPVDGEAEKNITDANGNKVTIKNVELLQELTPGVCSAAHSLRVNESAVTVRNGCGAVLLICFFDNSNFTPPQGQICDEEIRLESHIGFPHMKVITFHKAESPPIRNMILLEQFSEIQCVAGLSYSFTENVVSASDGCRGLFRVCYYGNETRQRSTFGVTTPEATTTQRRQETTRGVITAEVTTTRWRQETTTGVTTPEVITTRRRQETTTGVTTPEVITIQRRQETTRGVTTPEVITTQWRQGTTRRVTTPEVITTRQRQEATRRVTTPDVTTTRRRQETTRRAPTREVTTTRRRQETNRGVTTPEVITTRRRQKTTRGVTTPGVITTRQRQETTRGVTTPEVSTTRRRQETTRGVTTAEVTTTRRRQETTRGVTTPEVTTTRRRQETTRRVTTPEENITQVRNNYITYFAAGLGKRCQSVHLTSRHTRPVKRAFADEDGHLLTIRDVQLLNQASQVKCVKGTNYKFSISTVKVSGGCGGTFQICFDDDTTTLSTQSVEAGDECVQVTLRSTTRKSKVIEINDQANKPVQVVSVQVLKQFSEVPCDPWETFEYEGSRVRAMGGCGALFRICYGREKKEDKEASVDEDCVTVTLKSSANKPKTLVVTDKSNKLVHVVSVEVLKQISRVPCVDWKTFEFQGSRVRATGGCGAVFKVCYEKTSKKPRRHW